MIYIHQKYLKILNSCIGFDSGCVRRQMDNFVQDLISGHRDYNSDNPTENPEKTPLDKIVQNPTQLLISFFDGSIKECHYLW